jgi:hypothetical protein
MSAKARNTSRQFDLPKPSPFFAFPNPHELRSSPERVKDGSCGHPRGFALIQPLAKRIVVCPILICLLNVIENTSFTFIDLSQDETCVAGRSRVEIPRKLLHLGHVVTQESFLPTTVVRRLHPNPVALEEAVTLRRLIGRGNDDRRKLNLVVVFHSRFSEFKSAFADNNLNQPHETLARNTSRKIARRLPKQLKLPEEI